MCFDIGSFRGLWLQAPSAAPSSGRKQTLEWVTVVVRSSLRHMLSCWDRERQGARHRLLAEGLTGQGAVVAVPSSRRGASLRKLKDDVVWSKTYV